MQKFKFNRQTDQLFGAILSLDSVKEAEAFFRDLCTIKEISDMADRWEIANLINNQISYREIAARLKVSTTTVSRVATWLNNGQGGYKSAINKLHHHSLKLRRGLS